MRVLIPLSTLAVALFLGGCSSSGPSQTNPVSAAATAAPAPQNLTPEQKAQYDAAVQQAGPPASAPASKG